MFGEKDFIKTEGDINLSTSRARWMDESVRETSRYWLEKDSEVFIHQSLSTPCLEVLEECDGAFFKDINGKRYFDFHGNNVHQLGYRNDYVIAGIIRQLQTLPFSPRRFTNIPAIEAAEKLVSLCPGNLNKVLFTPGGATSIGLATKIARVATGRFKTLSMWDSFHGASIETISLGGESIFRQNIGPLVTGSEHVPYPDRYRGMFVKDGEFWDVQYADYIEFVMEREGDIAALVAEPIRNTAVHMPSPHFWKRIREICHKHGTLLIFDEVPTFMGRTGKFFVFENYQVIPDIVVIGKALGGGIIPFSAVIVNDQLSIPSEMSLGHYTFEKSPLGAAAALASIEFIEKEGLLGHILEMSKIMETRLTELYNRFDLIGDVRGIGMLWGLELVTDRQTKHPDTTQAEKIMYNCLKDGLSFKVSQGNVITLSPPLVITREELNEALDILESAIGEVVRSV